MQDLPGRHPEAPSPCGVCSHTWTSLAPVIPVCALSWIPNSSLAALETVIVGVSFLLYLPSFVCYFTSRRLNVRCWDSLKYIYGGGGRGRWPENLASLPINLCWLSTSSTPRTGQSLARGWSSSRFPKPLRLGMSSECESIAHKFDCDASEGSWTEVWHD